MSTFAAAQSSLIEFACFGEGGPLGAIHLCDKYLNCEMNRNRVLPSKNIDNADVIMTAMRIFIG